MNGFSKHVLGTFCMLGPGDAAMEDNSELLGIHVK